jgi:uncharacterized phage protein (TIGR02218 family)
VRTIPDGLAQRLGGAATTLARCWRLTRADGRVLGFTDHDEALEFGGTRFAAATGLSGSEAERALGLAPGTQEVEGALSALAITEEDIAAGLYDEARVESFLVEWREPEHFMRLDVATIGEVRRAGESFTAELRGPEAALDRERGRLYRRRCDAALGDARCGVDLAAGGRRVTGAVSSAEDTTAELAAGEIDPALFLRGQLTIGGESREIVGVSPGSGAGAWRLQIAAPFRVKPEAGADATMTAGCDKSFGTCRTRFSNQLNFRGFPHLPGTDAALSIAKRDDLHDGAPVVP